MMAIFSACYLICVFMAKNFIVYNIFQPLNETSMPENEFKFTKIKRKQKS